MNQRSALGVSGILILLPERRTLGGAGAVEIGLGIGELFGQDPIAAKVFARVAERKGVDHVAAPWRLAAPDTRFVLEVKTGRTWLDRCELELPESGARLLRRIAREEGQPVHTSLLGQELSLLIGVETLLLPSLD